MIGKRTGDYISIFELTFQRYKFHPFQLAFRLRVFCGIYRGLSPLLSSGRQLKGNRKMNNVMQKILIKNIELVWGVWWWVRQCTRNPKSKPKHCNHRMCSTIHNGKQKCSLLPPRGSKWGDWIEKPTEERRPTVECKEKNKLMLRLSLYPMRAPTHFLDHTIENPDHLLAKNKRSLCLPQCEWEGLLRFSSPL